MGNFSCTCGKELELVIDPVVELTPDSIKTILEGNFFVVTCPDCDRVLKMEEKCIFDKRGSYSLDFLPEADRASYHLGKSSTEKRDHTRIVIGYKELAEKIKLLEAGLDDRFIEILKYSLLTKQKKNLTILFNQVNGEKIEFFVEGLKEGEVGIIGVPVSTYESLIKRKDIDFKESPYKEFLSSPYINAGQIDYEDSEEA